MRRGYDARLPVSASWALEFAPVNVSVVFIQTDGNEAFCIGSRTWFFDELSDCVAEIRERFPWRVSEHVLPPESAPRIWELAFNDLRLFNVEHAPAYDDNRRMFLTQRFLRRLHIDTAPRPWENNEGNNADLIDSLNGYRVKELASHSEVFTMNVLGTHEQFLTRALEHFAAWEYLTAAAPWGPPPDYSKHDKAVIAGRR